jgi:hypothetical protein
MQDVGEDALLHASHGPVGAGDLVPPVSAIAARPHVLQSLLSVVASVTSRPSPSRGAAAGRRPGGGDSDQQVRFDVT